MTSKMLPFDIGIEQEFFITPNDRRNVILNAKEEMKKFFGFSIDQNDNYKGIPVGEFCDLVTDGTAMEIRGFFPISYYGYGNYSKPYSFEQQFEKVVESLACLKNYYIQTEAYVKNGELVYSYGRQVWELDNPNTVYSSGKTIRNAYTGEEIVNYKKEEMEDKKMVTVRTAGLHVHFSLQSLYKDADVELFSNENKYHIDNLIRLFDQIYQRYFHLQSAMVKRIENYQSYGLYRIKKPRDGTKSGLHTIEYRQPASDQLRYNFEGFVLLCQYAAYNYLIHYGFIKE